MAPIYCLLYKYLFVCVFVMLKNWHVLLKWHLLSYIKISPVFSLLLNFLTLTESGVSMFRTLMCICVTVHVFLCVFVYWEEFTLPVSLGRGGTGLFTECFWIWSKEFLTHSRPDVQWRKSLKHWAVFTGLTSDISCLLSESLKQKVKTYLKSFWRWRTIQSFVFYDKPTPELIFLPFCPDFLNPNLYLLLTVIHL